MNEERIELARRHLADFTLATMGKYSLTRFHDIYSSVLTLFARGEIKKLIISMPPQHGKSEQATRRLIAFLLGLSYDHKTAIASYSATKARKFGREIKRIMKDPRYKYLFPHSKLPTAKDKGYTNSADAVDMVGADGSILFVGRGSGLTGEPLDVLVMDDMYKNAMEAYSPIIREAVWEWYFSVADSRLHNDSQQLIVFTRWHEEDLIGQLEQHDTVEDLVSLDQLKEPTDKWLKLNLPAIMDHPPTDFDNRQMGEALWPERHSLARLERRRKANPDAFQALYQGDPRPVEGLLYQSGFNEWSGPIKDLPITEISAYADTADTGDDYLCCIVYGIGSDNFLYVLDLLYTDAPHEVTEGETSSILNKNRVDYCDIESNSGGRSFGKNVQKQLEEMGADTVIRSFHQSENKEARIITGAPSVMRHVLMPPQWRNKYPKFAKDLLGFRRLFKANTHDDAPDALTGAVEKSRIVEGTDLVFGRV